MKIAIFVFLAPLLLAAKPVSHLPVDPTRFDGKYSLVAVDAGREDLCSSPLYIRGGIKIADENYIEASNIPFLDNIDSNRGMLIPDFNGKKSSKEIDVSKDNLLSYVVIRRDGKVSFSIEKVVNELVVRQQYQDREMKATCRYKPESD